MYGVKLQFGSYMGHWAFSAKIVCGSFMVHTTFYECKIMIKHYFLGWSIKKWILAYSNHNTITRADVFHKKFRMRVRMTSPVMMKFLHLLSVRGAKFPVCKSKETIRCGIYEVHLCKNKYSDIFFNKF